MRATLPLLALGLVGCGGAASNASTLPSSQEIVDMEEMRITARPDGSGGFQLDSYDAETLFLRATELLNRQQCSDAVAHYDRVADEFPGSPYRSPSLYNAGLCLQDTGEREEAVHRYLRLLREEPESPDIKHASLQLAKLFVELERWDDAVQIADRLLTRDDLDSAERLEAMARRAQGLFGDDQLEGAARQARSALNYYRTRPEGQRIADEFFAATANYVLAETIRSQAERIEIPVADVETQHATLERRAQLLLNAQRAYFNTISLTNAHWAAAAGYQIGAMYDSFWHAVMSAPTPPPRNPLPEGTQDVYEEEYRLELARMVKPLIRHAIRYWELTLMMVERTGVQTDWAERVRGDLERARQRLLSQPPHAS